MLLLRCGDERLERRFMPDVIPCSGDFGWIELDLNVLLAILDGLGYYDDDNGHMGALRGAEEFFWVN